MAIWIPGVKTNIMEITINFMVFRSIFILIKKWIMMRSNHITYRRIAGGLIIMSGAAARTGSY